MDAEAKLGFTVFDNMRRPGCPEYIKRLFASGLFGFGFVLAGTASLCAQQEAIKNGIAYYGKLKQISFEADLLSLEAESNASSPTVKQDWRLSLGERAFWRATKYNDMTEEILASPDLFRAVTHTIVNGESTTVFLSRLKPGDVKPEIASGIGVLGVPFGFFFARDAELEFGDILSAGVQSSPPDHGGAVIDVDAEGMQGTFAVDPQRDYMTNKILLTWKGPGANKSGLSELSYEVVRSENVRGIWIPTEFATTVVWAASTRSLPPTVRYVNGALVVAGENVGEGVIQTPARRVESKIQLGNIEIGRAGPFEIRTPIPDGTRVHMQDAGHLHFVWIKGRVVGMTSEAVQALKDVAFVQPATGFPWYPCILAIASFGAVAWIIWRQSSTLKR